MGMTLRDPSQADFNQLKKMLVDGTITPQQLQGADVSYSGPPERIDQSSQNMLAQMMQAQDSPQISQGQQAMAQAALNQASASQAQSPEVRQGGGYMQMDGGPRQSIGSQNGPSPQQLSDQASVSKNADGVALSKLTAGDGYQGLRSGQGLIRMTQPDGATEDRYINDGPTGAQAAQAAPMKLYGYGDGTLSSLGNASPDSSASTDISRNPVNVPGLGTGYYSKDGRSAIITNSDGSKSQVLLGYDRAGSLAIDAANMQRQKTQGDITHTAAETALVNAKVDEYGKPDAAAANKSQLADIINPLNNKELIKVDVNKYQPGTGIGAPGVVGTSGKEPTAALRDETQTKGVEGLQETLDAMRAGYQKLLDNGDVTDTDASALHNLGVSIQTSDTGQKIGRMVGTESQSTRDKIIADRRQLLSSIKQLSGAGTREFGTNFELKNWNAAVGGPEMSAQTNMAILDSFENKYIKPFYARKAAEAALSAKNSSGASNPALPNEMDPSNSSSNAAPPLIRSADTSASIRNAQAAINSGKWTRAQAIQKLRSAGIMDAP